jgi:hypothetical protein
MNNKQRIENYKIIEKMCKESTNNLKLIKDIKGIVLNNKEVQNDEKN